jgi:hypothetical protein
MTKRVFGVVLGIVAFAASGAARQRPNLSATWAASPDAPRTLPAAPSPTMGARFAIRIEGDALTLTRPTRDDSMAVTFTLDGTRSSYSIPGRLCEGESEVMETATWEGDALALTVVGRVPAGGGATSPLSVKRLMRLDGDTLVEEAAIAQQGGGTRQVATVYKRADPSPPHNPGPARSPAAPATIAQVAWIAGFWSGPNGTVNVEERWTAPASGGMIGVGRTLRGSATLASFEFLCMAERSGTLVYAAMPDARSPATLFTLTAVTADSATFENPAHDYPKLIRYAKRPDGSLETTISGAANQRAVTMVLKRQE